MTRDDYDALGHNSGGPITPRRFKIYPAYFLLSDTQRAAALIHETLHDWHIDHQVHDPQKDERRPAYFGRLVRQIAKDKPRQARRNPDNYARFALAVSGHPIDP